MGLIADRVLVRRDGFESGIEDSAAPIHNRDGQVVGAVQNADSAMYHAKANGRNNYQYFKPAMNTLAVERMFIRSNLRRALKQGEFVPHYQPQIDLASGRMTGTESLIRWLDPDRGVIYPDQFIPVAEECGLIVPIGRSVLREACTQVQAWLDAGLRAVSVAVIISALEFRHRNFVEGLALILKETGTGTDRKHTHGQGRVLGGCAGSAQGHGGTACHR